LVDNLNYAYNSHSNKILKVDDASGETASFSDVTTATDYTYNLDGSLASDANKGITIEYNYLKLPRRIVKGSTVILNEYDATGKKLKETIGSNTTDYVGNKIYKNGVLYQTSQDEGRIINGEYEYNLNDHLGNLRVAFKDNAGVPEITQSNAYGVWGEDLPTLGYLKSTWKKDFFKYTGKEELQETGYIDFGARLYDNLVPRFITIDPKAHKMPFASPYNYCLNNPINMVDPDGQIPYPITIRAFAPFKTFGFGFHGDGRGYSTGNVSARLHQKINFDTDKTTMTTSAWSSSSSHNLNPSYKKTATPSVNFTGDFTINQNGENKTFGFGSHVAAANPLTPPGSPDIDIFSNFSITENKKAGTLSISGELKGDNFPSTEAFVTDPNGNNVFIGVGQIGAEVGANTGPFTELPGENSTNPITSFNFTISTDKKGNFTGVTEGKTTYSIADWNKRFTSKPAQKTE
jgi:RHS repeat-associated protein